jgi:AraC-like DNA-binding protein
MLLGDERFRRLAEARDALERADETRPVAAIARLAGVSPYHFIRQFKAVFGVTPHQCRVLARLDRARHLLAHDRSSVTGVCLAVGSSSLGSFSALFHQRTGQSPSEFRDRLRALFPDARERQAALAPGCLTIMGGAISEKQRGGASPTMTGDGGRNADQAHEHHGGRPDEGAEVLHGRARLHPEARHSRRRVPMDHRRLPRRTR